MAINLAFKKQHEIPINSYNSHLFQNVSSITQRVQLYCTEEKLTHTNKEGKAKMVDISNKAVTQRTATAEAKIHVGKKITNLIKQNNIKKGDVLTVAQLAGIIASKKTSELIPLCHNIPINSVDVTARLDEGEECVSIVATVNCSGKTGVEMEALTAVSIGALTVYDMCKAVNHNMVITDIRLLEKTGGTRGDYKKA